MNKLLFIVLIGMAGVGLYVFATRRREEEEQPKPFRPGLPPVETDRVESMIVDYLDKLQQDIGQYELSSFYSYQYNLTEYKTPYTRQVAVISSLSGLGLNAEEVRAGNEILIRKASEQTQGRNLDWGTSLAFLKDLAAVSGRLAILHKVYDKIKDRQAVDQEIEQLQRTRKELITRYG